MNDFTNADRANTGSMKWGRYPPEVLPMWVADMDFRAAEPIMRALRERLDHGVFGYSEPPEGFLETCCAYFRRKWDWEVRPEWIVVSPGLGVVIHTVSRHMGDRQSAVVVPEPIYHVFRKAVPLAGRRRVDIRMVPSADGWELDMDALARAGREHGAGVLMLCNPHNPTGKVFGRAELEKIADIALRSKWVICSGEVHADLILDEGKRHVAIASISPEVADACITMQSPSKAYNVAGLNFGVAVIADEKLRAAYEAGARGQVVSHLNPFGIAAATAAWGGQCDGWLAECVECLRDNHDTIMRATSKMRGISMRHMDATYLAWLDVSELRLDDPPGHFLSHGLGLSPGADFGDANFMRLNFGCDKKSLAEGLGRLAKATA